MRKNFLAQTMGCVIRQEWNARTRLIVAAQFLGGDACSHVYAWHSARISALIHVFNMAKLGE